MRITGTPANEFIWVVVKWSTVERLADDIIDVDTGSRIVEDNRARIEHAASAIFDTRGADPLVKPPDPDPEGIVRGGVIVQAGDLD
jgi:hypothetical protein